MSPQRYELRTDGYKSSTCLALTRCGFRHTDLFNAVCTALRCCDIMAGKKKRLGQCLYPSGLTATSPKIGEDGRRYLGRMVRAGEGEWLDIFYTPPSLRDTSPRGGGSDALGGWCGDMGKGILGSGAGEAGRCGWYGYEYELTYDLWTGDAGCV